jgi:hypothetical protein
MEIRCFAGEGALNAMDCGDRQRRSMRILGEPAGGVIGSHECAVTTWELVDKLLLHG